jgi:tripartite-type tricarboxylate transporter receptor subunit TctC
MKLSRYQFLRLAAGATVLPVVPRIAKAQSYPTRPVRLIAGFPAGGGTDGQNGGRRKKFRKKRDG